MYQYCQCFNVFVILYSPPRGYHTSGSVKLYKNWNCSKTWKFHILDYFWHQESTFWAKIRRKWSTWKLLRKTFFGPQMRYSKVVKTKNAVKCGKDVFWRFLTMLKRLSGQNYFGNGLLYIPGEYYVQIMGIIRPKLVRKPSKVQ